LWGCFLAEHGIVDGDVYQAENQRFYDQYRSGSLDIHEFLRFQLGPLASHKRAQLEQWRQQFMKEKIDPVLLPKAHDLLDRHRRQGDEILIITATNRFITSPIAERYAVHHLLATEPEVRNGEYTGEITGTPCFQAGKVERLQSWIDEHEQTLEGSWFYSDSHNDLPLLEHVDHPVAVDPDATLGALAQARGWPIISLR
jgi:HAD superfamily hydrolase (TIGR01490 family)